MFSVCIQDHPLMESLSMQELLEQYKLTDEQLDKKSGESRTPIRYNVMIHLFITVDSQLSIARSIHLPASMSPSYMDELCICLVLGEIITKLQHSTFRHYA